MQSTPFSPLTLPCTPTFSRSTVRTKKVTIRKSDARTFAWRGEDNGPDQYSGGHLVDREMVVLRKRIHEMRMVEQNYEPPPEWMDWEKRCHKSYDSIICEAMGFLQSQIMNARPSVILGVATLLVFSVPMFWALAFLRLVEMAREILATFHLCA